MPPVLFFLPPVFEFNLPQKLRGDENSWTGALRSLETGQASRSRSAPDAERQLRRGRGLTSVPIAPEAPL